MSYIRSYRSRTLEEKTEHAADRLLERYGIRLTMKLLFKLRGMMRKGNYRTLKVWRDSHRSVEVVELEGQEVTMLWSWIMDAPVTFLPPEAWR